MNELGDVVPYAREPRPGVITAGQPGPAAWSAVAAAGIGTVLDIREAWEPRGHDEATAVEAAGLRYINVPFGHGAIPGTTFERVREVMREAGEGPVLVHCAAGNRVGAALNLAIAALEHARRVGGEEEVAA